MGGGGGGRGDDTEVGVSALTLSVQLPEPPPYGYTVTVWVPASSVPLHESSRVPPLFVHEKLFTRQSISRFMPVSERLTSELDDSLNLYVWSPETPVSSREPRQRSSPIVD